MENFSKGGKAGHNSVGALRNCQKDACYDGEGSNDEEPLATSISPFSG